MRAASCLLVVTRVTAYACCWYHGSCCCCRAPQAAYSLPRWLKPETASNRVWLRGGQLHVVPPPSAKAPTLPAAPTVAEALAVLRSGSVETRRKR